MILSRVRLLPQIRYDLEDFIAEQSGVRTDSKLWTKQFLSASNYILKGFSVTGLGLKQATVQMANATLIHGENTSDFSWFTAEASPTNITVTDAELQDGAKNYIELVLSTETNTSVTKAFWDPAANSGAGAEFNQEVDTIVDLSVSVAISVGGFTGNPNRIPIAIVETDGSGNIVGIRDKRKLFFRLGTPSSPSSEFTWTSRLEPEISLTLSSVSGTFVAGETITFSGGAVATVSTGGTTTIKIRLPDSDSFALSNTATGSSSAATGTIVNYQEDFVGADKDIGDIREMFEAVMTEIKKLKGTSFWYQTASGSLEGVYDAINNQIVGITSGARWHWTGSVLNLTDDSVSPSVNDSLASLVILGKSQVLNLRRQDGTGSSTTIAVADGQALFIKLPSSGNRNYSGNGAGTTNYQVVTATSFVREDDNYWLAIRKGNKLYVRGYGELQPGESGQIGDPISQQILDYIGATSEADDAPNYTSNSFVSDGESLTSGISTLDDAVARFFSQLRIVPHTNPKKVKITNSDVTKLDNTVLSQSTKKLLLSFSGATINLETGVVLASDDTTPLGLNFTPFSISSNQYFWYSITLVGTTINADNTINAQVIVLPAAASNASLASAPKAAFANGVALGQVYVQSSGGSSINNVTFANIVQLGIGSGSGSGGSGNIATYYDPITTTLPSGASLTVDGNSISDGESVLFTALSSGVNNAVYEVAGVGTSITWRLLRDFNNGPSPVAGESVRIAKGTAFNTAIAVFNGTTFKINDVVRFFNGTDYWEITSLKTATLLNNASGNIFSVALVGSENITIEYSVMRGITKDTGHFIITSDGTSVTTARYGANLGITGIDLSADIVGGNIRFRYTADNSGSSSTIKYFIKRWSNSAGGPAGVPTYTATSSNVSAAGNITDIQYHGSGGALSGDSDFQWDDGVKELLLGNLSLSAMVSSLSILDNQSVDVTLLTIDKTLYKFLIFDYSIERGAETRVGRLLVTHNGVIATINDDQIDTGGAGISNFDIIFSASLSGGNLLLQYVSSNTGVSGTFKYSVRKWL